MTFQSILFGGSGILSDAVRTTEPDSFRDLNLDQLVDAITAGKKQYDLKPFFYTPLRDAKTVCYRQQVMQDMENPHVMGHIQDFAAKMAVMRRYLALSERLVYYGHKEGWFLEAARVYCEAITDLESSLGGAAIDSPGLVAFRRHVTDYVRSDRFQSLLAAVQAVHEGLRQIRYCVIIQDNKFTVRRYEGESDYGKDVEQLFAAFREGAVTDYRVELEPRAGMNRIEAKILEFVARLYPEPFAALDAFYAQQRDLVDETIRVFDREIQFYVAYLQFIADIKRRGLGFCYPQVSATDREVYARDAFDLALAHATYYSGEPVVVNDFFLRDPERIIVVSGPNQGGKTTFARMVGQLHHLASLGCPVPGSEARLFLCDQILTQFEREEDIRNLRGKLKDDLVRIHGLLDSATPDSLLILNEILSSTSLQDAIFLSREIMSRVIELDSLCVWVTFIDELSSLSEKTVSMVSTVDPEDHTVRTYKIIRQPADGLAYALSIARKHRLTFEQIKERIRS